MDDSDQAGALAYHDLTDEGLPISKVFVKTIKADNASVSVGATHEICEMAVDPWLNSACPGSGRDLWAGEVCDPVEDNHQYGYEIGGVLVTGLRYAELVCAPTCAERHNDLKGHANAPFKIFSRGLYARVRSASGMAAGHRVYGEAQQTGRRYARRSRRENGAFADMDKPPPRRRPCQRDRTPPVPATQPLAQG